MDVEKDMVTFPAYVERWRELAVQEGEGIPSDLILAIIKNESEGQPGERARKSTRFPKVLERRDGSKILVDRALGLMQVIPLNILDYSLNVEPVTYEDMTGKSREDARMQIRLGVHVLRNALIWVHDQNPSSYQWPEGALTGEQIWMGLATYAVGQKRVRKKLRRLKQEGRPVTWASIVKRFPGWGLPDNNPIGYVRKIALMLDSPNVVPLIRSPRTTSAAGGGKGAGLMVLGLLIALAFVKRKKRK